MSRKPTMNAAAMARQQRRELRRLMQDVAKFARQKKAEALAEGLFDPVPATGGRVLEGRVEGDKVIVDPPPVPSRRRRPPCR